MRQDVLSTGVFAVIAAVVAFFVLSNYSVQLVSTCQSALSALNCASAIEIAKYAVGIIGLLGVIQIIMGFTSSDRGKITTEINITTPKFEPLDKSEKVFLICPWCGARNEDKSKYCSQCGGALEIPPRGGG